MKPNYKNIEQLSEEHYRKETRNRGRYNKFVKKHSSKLNRRRFRKETDDEDWS